MKRVLISIMLCVIGMCCIHAQSFDSLARQIIDNNPEIKSSQASIESDLLQLRSENNLPDPEVGFEHLWAPNGIKNKWNASISQSFDWPGVYKARSKAYKSASSALEFLERSRYVDKALEVKLLFVDIINVQKNVALCDSSIALFNELKRHYQVGYEQGEFTRLDINKINVEQLRLSRQRASLENQLRVLEGSISAMNGGLDCDAILASLTNYPTEPLYSIDDYDRVLQSQDPQINYVSLMVESERYAVKAAKLSSLPSFTLGYVHANEEGNSFNGLSISMTLPIFSNRHKAKAAEAIERASAAELSGVKVDKSTAMRTDYAIAANLANEIAQYKSTLDENYISLLHKALIGGEISLINFIQEVNYFQEAIADMYAVEYEYYQVLTRLNKYSILQELSR